MNDDKRDASEHDLDAKHDERGGRNVTTRDRIEHEPNPAERGTWLSVVIGLLGLWLIVQSVWLDLTPDRFWNAVLVGAALLAVGAYNFSRRANEEFGLGTYSAIVIWNRRTEADARATATYDRTGQ